MTTATVEKKAKKARPRPLLDAKQLVQVEQDLRKQYPNVIKGSLRNVGDDPDKNPEWASKRTVEIKCAHPGCTATRRIATSDLHQVTMCVEHTMAHRLERRRIARQGKAKKTKVKTTAKAKATKTKAVTKPR